MPKKMIAFTLSLFFVMLLPFSTWAAGNDVCARVKIEIRQELTLERQGFDAHMRITNGLADIRLENVRVQVSFADQQGNAVPASSDPENTNALFFIRVDSMQNVDEVDGTGTVAPALAADIHWLIIPAPGSSNGLRSGQLYYVGAVLTYTVNGETHTTEVSPDYIFVKPMPQLSIDYFLPDEVFADDAFTADIEPPVPFTLGVRVKNSGAGIARDFKIDSAQPRIVENEQGLLIDFMIDGSTLDDQPANDSLLVNFGDIAPAAAKTARWVMHCTLSGKFVKFSAEFSHSNELGGELTSLIEAVNTHFLVRDVCVDLPDRDQARDFLARDGGVYRVYESQNTETEVLDQSALSSLNYLEQNGSAVRCALTTTPAAGLLFIHLPDPYQGRKIIKAALRSDGKRIKAENIWLSKIRDGQGWKYFVNLFDVGGTDRYTLTFDDPASLPQAPVLQFIPDKTRVEGEQLSFLVAASDPDGTVPVLSAVPLPAGAHFTNQGGGHGTFDWTPAVGQAGNYLVSFRASDGTFTAAETVAITVYSASDTDGDGQDDSWERAFFGNLDRDGHGDFDGDGFSDRDEFENGTDPTRENNVPGVPLIAAPLDGDEIEVLTPLLVVNNSTDPDGDPVTYEFEVYSGSGLRTLVARESEVAQKTDTSTAWQVPAALQDNHMYTWRVRASDGIAHSLWQYGSIFVNTSNDDPGTFHASQPGNDGHVCSLSPELQVTNARDVDRDQLTYVFELYTDSTMGTPVINSDSMAQGTAGTTSWVVDTILNDASWYFWRVVATDEHGRQSQTALMSFFVDTQNSVPQRPFISSPANGVQLPGSEADLAVANSSDPQGDPLTYYFEVDTVSTFDGPEKQVSPEVQEDLDETTWRVAGLRDNTRYYWRARASDGSCSSDWEQGTFFVNTSNDVPLVPVSRNPGENAWVGTLKPVLETAPGVDADQEPLTYEFEVYGDAALTDLVDHGQSSSPQWEVPVALSDKTQYYWRARVVDQQGAAGEWMAAVPIFVKAVDVEPPEHIRLQVWTDSGVPIAEVRVFAFTESGSYTGRWSYTDETGTALFNTAEFADGTYHFRVDYRGNQFWSNSLTLPDSFTLDMTIPVQPVLLTVTAATGPVAGVKVYLFTPGGSYLGIYALTDAAGRVDFDLPVGKSFKFRSDILGNQYWSDVTSVAVGGSGVVMDVGGGCLQIIFERAANDPKTGVQVYLFSEAGRYLGHVETTDADGRVTFDLSQGTYKVRADYLGYHFWSDDMLVAADTVVELTIDHQDVALAVDGLFQGEAEPLAGLKGYLFNSDGSYLGLYGVTDEDGQVAFSLPRKAYKVRVDVMGGQFWSREFVDEPPGQLIAVDIPMAEAEVSVTGAGLPRDGVKVYLFSAAGSYLGRFESTDTDGRATFRIPEGVYSFRVDYQGSQFWSGEQTLARDQINSVNISTGGGAFTLTVQTGDQQPLPGVRVYVFRESGSYLGLAGAGDENGDAGFELSDGSYRFRADYLGQQFWSDSVIVPDDHTAGVTIVEAPVALTVTAAAGSSAGVRVYLFSPDGAYLDRCGQTDADGRVTFDLPVGRSFKLRADILGNQYWSDVILVEDSGSSLTIDTGGGHLRVNVERAPGSPLENINVYLFSETEHYLGRVESTDTSGTVGFDVSTGSYKLRVDYLGYRFWTEVYRMTTDLSDTLTIDHRDVEITVQGIYQEADPLSGVKVYLFSASGSYLNRYQLTDAEGQVRFALPDRPYKVRVDYLGGQYWSTDFQFQDTTVGINQGRAKLHICRSASNVPNAYIYVFSDAGSYLGCFESTDIGGTAVFTLPAETFKFRVDSGGDQYWSEAVTLVPGVTSLVEVDLDNL